MVMHCWIILIKEVGNSNLWSNKKMYDYSIQSKAFVKFNLRAIFVE